MIGQANSRQGYERDTETGNDQAIFRYFNPRWGRFMSADPLSGDLGNPQSLNRFAYVMNNPANLFDPLGLCTDETRNISCFETQASSPLGSNGSWFWLFAASGPGFGDFLRMIMGIPPSSSNSGTSTTTAETPDPPKPPSVQCTTGLSAGYVAGVTAAAGAPATLGGVATASVGAGVFTNFRDTASFGGFASGGVGGNAGDRIAGLPRQDVTAPGVFGAGAGVGFVGAFILNASTATQLKNHFFTAGVELGHFRYASVQLNIGKDVAGNTIWQVSVSGGIGEGAGVYKLTTNTVTASTSNACQ